MTDIDLDDLERATRSVLAGEFKGLALWPAAIGLADHTLALIDRVRAAQARIAQLEAELAAASTATSSGLDPTRPE